MSYDDIIEDTFPENWNDDLVNLSTIQDIFEVSPEDLRAIASIFPSLRNQFNINGLMDFSNQMKSWVEGVLKKSDDGIFIRTSYGSFKQNPFSYAPITSWSDINSTFRWPDTRIEKFLRNRLTFGEPIHIIASPWYDIPSWSEFRVFIRERKTVGVSQYNHHQAYTEINTHIDAIKASLLDLNDQLIEALHMDTVIADVFMKQQSDGKLKAIIIEINPFIQQADPCLFSWNNGGDFDGTFRFRKNVHNPYRGKYSQIVQRSELEVFRESDYGRQGGEELPKIGENTLQSFDSSQYRR